MKGKDFAEEVAMAKRESKIECAYATTIYGERLSFYGERLSFFGRSS